MVGKVLLGRMEYAEALVAHDAAVRVEYLLQRVGLQLHDAVLLRRHALQHLLELLLVAKHPGTRLDRRRGQHAQRAESGGAHVDQRVRRLLEHVALLQTRQHRAAHLELVRHAVVRAALEQMRHEVEDAKGRQYVEAHWMVDELEQRVDEAAPRVADALQQIVAPERMRVVGRVVVDAVQHAVHLEPDVAPTMAVLPEAAGARREACLYRVEVPSAKVYDSVVVDAAASAAAGAAAGAASGIARGWRQDTDALDLIVLPLAVVARTRRPAQGAPAVLAAVGMLALVHKGLAVAHHRVYAHAVQLVFAPLADVRAAVRERKDAVAVLEVVAPLALVLVAVRERKHAMAIALIVAPRAIERKHATTRQSAAAVALALDRFTDVLNRSDTIAATASSSGSSRSRRSRRRRTATALGDARRKERRGIDVRHPAGQRHRDRLIGYFELHGRDVVHSPSSSSWWWSVTDASQSISAPKQRRESESEERRREENSSASSSSSLLFPQAATNQQQCDQLDCSDGRKDTNL